MIYLYHAPRSRSLRVRWLLEELELDYQLRPVDIYRNEGQSAAYLEVHPLGQVPAIQIQDETVFESGAICLSLAELYPDKGLAPAQDAMSRRAFLQWYFYALTTLEAPAIQFLQHAFLLPKPERIKALLPIAKRVYLRALVPLEEKMRDQDFILGTSFSVTDIMLGSVLMWLPKLLTDSPSLAAYVKRLQLRSAYQAASGLS